MTSQLQDLLQILQELKEVENDRENWVIFKDVHEPIIERSVFEQVQQKWGQNPQAPHQRRQAQYVLRPAGLC